MLPLTDSQTRNQQQQQALQPQGRSLRQRLVDPSPKCLQRVAAELLRLMLRPLKLP
jgi:membrane protein insertase Oxa1/YidC/SpoIIIJ